MKEVAIEDLTIGCLLTFCENVAELGCPHNEDVDMWFRNLSYDEAYEVADSLIEMMRSESREMTLKEVHDYAKSNDSLFLAKDFCSQVCFDHLDGTHCCFANSKFEKINGDRWFIFYTEHHGVHVYHYEDLKYVFVDGDEVYCNPDYEEVPF